MSLASFTRTAAAIVVIASPISAEPLATTSQQQLLERFDAEAAAATAEWLKKKNAAEETQQFINALGKLAPGDPRALHLEALNARLKKELTEAQIAEGKALELNQKAFHAHALVVAAPAVPQQQAQVAAVPQPAQSSGRPAPAPLPSGCSLETEEEMKTFNPGECLGAASGVSQGTISVLGRVVDKQGVTASLAISGAGSKANLKFADTYTIRSRHPGPDFYQRKWTLGYNIGIQSTNVTGNEGRLGGLSERSQTRSLTDLDRLDEKVSLTAGISFNKFPKVRENAFLAGVNPIVQSARLACEQSFAANERALRCTGKNLVEWINQSKEHLAQLTSQYWGSAQEVAEWGVGLQGEVARPVFSYFSFDTVEVPDPLKPGSTKRVIDLTRLPTGFPDDPVREAKVPFALTSYAFRHFPFRWKWNEGMTVIGSGTWKRSFEIEKARRDVIICPVVDGVPIQTNETCRTVNVAAPTALSEYLIAGELRTKFGAFWVFPSVGFAPKFTQELRRGRRSLDVPFYVSADKDGKLNGGIKLKWDTGGKDVFGTERKDELLLSIFFGTTFDFNVTP